MIPFALLAALVACTPEAPPEKVEVVRPVRTEVVEEVGGALGGTFSGTAAAGDQATLSFMMGGIVADIDVKVGDRVKTGDRLASLDDTQLRLQVEQAQAGLANARASLTLAKQTLERTEGLYLGNSASAADVEAVRANHSSARAQYQSGARQLELARKQRSDAVLEANRDGSVSQVLTNAGQVVGAGTPVIVLTPDQQLQVVVAVPTGWIGRLDEGASTTVVFADLGTQTHEARVTEVGVTASSGSFPVTVELLDLDAAVRPGMVATVEFVVEQATERRIELPLSAIGQDTKGRFVWQVEKGEADLGTAHRMAVTTGELTSTGRIEVEGVDTGALVVTAGISLVYEGRPVRLVSP